MGIAEGQEIGPYVVVRKLGAGGMGEVYLARHRILDRAAAVKVLLPEISLNQEVVSRFFTEARATAKLRHPNIVEIFDCDVLPDRRAYIVMEFLPGESLRNTLDRVRTLSPDFRSIAAITGMVADALHVAHENGIVHRDLKPDNIFLTASPSRPDQLTAKVLDFGIAKLLSNDSQGMNATRTGSLIGTPLYMSPEQCRGLPTIGHSSDIYSLGCVLFEMVVATPPFAGAGPGDILMGHISQTPPAMSALQPGVPSEIDALARHMMAKEPSQQPQSMAQVVGAIEEFLGLHCSEFGTALSWPTGFPNSPALTPNKFMTPVGTLSGGRTPPPATPANQSKYAASSPGEAAARRGLPGMASPGTRVRAETITALVRPWRKWVVAVAAAVALVLVAGGVYFFTRPSSASRRPSERPAQTLSPPAPSQPAVNRVEPIQPAPSPDRIPSAPSPADIGRPHFDRPPCGAALGRASTYNREADRARETEEQEAAPCRRPRVEQVRARRRLSRVSSLVRQDDIREEELRHCCRYHRWRWRSLRPGWVSRTTQSSKRVEERRQRGLGHMTRDIAGLTPDDRAHR